MFDLIVSERCDRDDGCCAVVAAPTMEVKQHRHREIDREDRRGECNFVCVPPLVV